MSARRVKNTPDAEEDAGSLDLLDEIKMLRKLLQDIDQTSPDKRSQEQLRMIDVVARACGQMARMLRVQSTLGGQDELAEEIGRVAEDIRKQIAGQGDV